MKFKILIVAMLASLLWSLAPAAQAGMPWAIADAGIEHLSGTVSGVGVQAARFGPHSTTHLELVVPAVSFGRRFMRPSQVCALVPGCRAAANADMFNTATGNLIGGASIRGKLLAPAQNTPPAHQQVNLLPGGKMTTSPGIDPGAELSWGASYTLVHSCQPVTISENDDFTNRPFARTVFGRDQAGNTLLLTLSGASLQLAATIAQQLGLCEAINLDGGPSSSLSRQGLPLTHAGAVERAVPEVLLFVAPVPPPPPPPPPPAPKPVVTVPPPPPTTVPLPPPTTTLPPTTTTATSKPAVAISAAATFPKRRHLPVWPIVVAVCLLTAITVALGQRKRQS